MSYAELDKILRVTNLPIWGADGIDEASIKQMQTALEMPCAVSGALMPDAHLGYGLPIGGVLALDNAVCPYAVGVDIACRMKMSIWDTENDAFSAQDLGGILEKSTFFGVGRENNLGYNHKVLGSHRWNTSLLGPLFEKAKRQLGTSGSGNHFAEFGVLTPDLDWTLPNKLYLALMTHSGSRGTGAAVCNHYSKLAKALHPELGDLGYFELGTTLGDEYWEAMSLMGEYAASNHDCIHDTAAKLLKREPVLKIENHHNFAWKENHNGREVIVHRKGATPAGNGVLGIIPGSMGTPAYVVQGLGNKDSLCSASHGAGRLMSRTQAKKTFNLRHELAQLRSRGIFVLSCGADEVPGVYKDIEAVMAAQTDLVQPLAKFDPWVIKMSEDGKAED